MMSLRLVTSEGIDARTVFGYNFTYEDVINRAINCLKYYEIEVADLHRQTALIERHRREIEERHKKEGR